VRTRYQHGTIELKQRARGPAIWQFRWRDKTGTRMSEDIGTTTKYHTKSAVDRSSKVAYLRMKINSDQPAIPEERFGVVLERYVQEEIPKRFSTQHAYLSYINNHIRPRWGESPLTEVNPLAVRDWLKSIRDKKGNRSLASKTKGHIKGLMHRIFDCAMLWEYLPADRNPMSLVRNRRVVEAQKKAANSNARGVFDPRRRGRPGALSHHGHPGPLHGREML
jgi:integrase